MRTDTALAVASPVIPLQFVVTATQEIRTPKRSIRVGDHLLIDPTVTPSIGKMVLIGERFELWCGQQDVSGVLAAVWEDESCA